MTLPSPDLQPTSGSDNRPDRPAVPVRLVEYPTYPEAEAAVDQLSDLGFPVNTVSIVWSGLRRVEHVTGRMTVLSAGLGGAVAGAWFGTLIGLLFSLFTEDASVIGVMFTYFVVGAIAGGLWQAVGHALQRGRRDFATVPQLDAERYELWVDPRNRDLAAELLALGPGRVDDDPLA